MEVLFPLVQLINVWMVSEPLSCESLIFQTSNKLLIGDFLLLFDIPSFPHKLCLVLLNNSLHVLQPFLQSKAIIVFHLLLLLSSQLNRTPVNDLDIGLEFLLKF